MVISETGFTGMQLPSHGRERPHLSQDTGGLSNAGALWLLQSNCSEHHSRLAASHPMPTMLTEQTGDTVHPCQLLHFLRKRMLELNLAVTLGLWAS